MKRLSFWAASAALFFACVAPAAAQQFCFVSSAAPTWNVGEYKPLSCDTSGNLRTSGGGGGGGSVTQGTSPWVISGTITLPTGAATSANQPTNAAQGSTTSGQTGTLVQGAVTTAAPSYTNAQTSPLSLTTGGMLRVDASGTVQAVSQSGTWRTGSEGVFYSSALGSAATYSGTAGTAKAIGGLQTISSIFTANDGSGILTYVSIKMNEGQTSPLTVYLFRANPAASTCTDNATFVLNSADSSKLILEPIVITPQDMTGITESFGSYKPAMSVKNGDATPDLYACIVTGSSLTLAAASVVLSVGVSQNY
jgi:hypothetical protein